MAGLAARYPYYQIGEATWEAYWEDLHCIPKQHLMNGLFECRMMCKRFPTVPEIVEASVGSHFSIVPHIPGQRPSTTADIMRVYFRRYEAVELSGPEVRKQIDDGRKS